MAKATYKDIVKTVGLLGIGVYALTKEKAEKMAKSLQKTGALNEKDGKKMVRKLLADSKKQTAKLEKDVTALVKKNIKSMPLASKKDLSRLEKRIAKLEKSKKRKAKKK